ncbi:MAG: DUF805 domain-containing protein [Lentisphaerae bacterium]|nr:DUF805 domain-containing protein [Lentisphaerota bacterium]
MKDFSRWGVPVAQAVPPPQMPSGYPPAPGLVVPSVYPGIPVAQSLPQGPRPPVQKGLFKGRLSRRSYWIYVLATMLIRSLVGIAFCCNVNALQFLMLLELFLFLPDMVAGVKRSHDTGKSGLLVLLLAMPRILTAVIALSYLCIVDWFIPFNIMLISGLALDACMIVFYFFMTRPTAPDNQYGPAELPEKSETWIIMGLGIAGIIWQRLVLIFVRAIMILLLALMMVTDFSCSFIDDDDDLEKTAAVNIDGTLDPDGDYHFSTRILSANYRCAPLGSTGILVWVIDLVEDADEVAGKVKDDIRGEIGSYTREFER